MSDEAAAEDLLQEAKEKERHTSEPASVDGGGDSGEELGVVGALVEELQAIERGESHSNVTARSASLAALLRAYEESGELAGLVDSAAEQVDGGAGEYDATVAAAVKVLVRIGLEETRPKVFEELEDAARRKESESATRL